MKTNEWNGRFSLLFFDCFMGFGVYFCQDIPSALQKNIQGRSIPCNITSNSTCCDDCLGLGPDRYNELYSVYSWMNALLALPGGYMIDRIGNRAGAFVVSTLATIGAIIFALAASFNLRYSPLMFPLMITGRIFLGTSAGCTLIVQDRIVAFWFRDKMALAFGITYTMQRLGNVVNFFVTDNIFSMFGLTAALWAGAIVCLCSFCGAVIFAILDVYGTRKLDNESQSKMVSMPIRLRDVRSFPVSYWLIAFMISSYYSCYIPFVGNGSKFIQDKYGYSETDASYINGAVYDTCCLLFPILGVILDKKGGRLWTLLLATYFTVPIFPVMYYTDHVHPLVFCIWLGVVYTVACLCLWSLVALIVPATSIGTACGIATFLLGTGVGLSNLGFGVILGSHKETSHRLRAWKWAFILLTSIAGFCAVCGTILNLSNRKLVKKLNGVVSEKNDCIENEENEKKEKLINDEHQNERKRLLSDATEKGDFYSSFNNSVEVNFAV